MYDLPEGQLSWLVRASADCLPSYANLRRWGKTLSDKCALCPFRETMHHALNCCKTALEQKRFNYRHDSILLHIVRQLQANKPRKRIVAALEGFRIAANVTIPPEVVVTALKPDLVLIDEETGDMEIFDLTSCADREHNINEARVFKQRKYAPLIADIKATGRKAKFSPFEVCALGNIRADSKKTLRSILGAKTARKTLQTLSKMAVSCSRYIFRQRREKQWQPVGLFKCNIQSSEIQVGAG